MKECNKQAESPSSVNFNFGHNRHNSTLASPMAASFTDGAKSTGARSRQSGTMMAF